MIKDYLQFINENHYLDLSETIKVLHDICYELKDEDIKYSIQPDNEIKVKMLSLVLQNKIEKRDIDFYLLIDVINRKLTDQVKRSGMFSSPDWFVDVLNRIQDYMSGIGFEVLYSVIYYSGDKIYLDEAGDIYDIHGLIKSIRLDFKKKINESYNKPRAGGKKRWSVKYKKSINCNNPKGFSQKQYCKRKQKGGAYKN